MFVNGTMKQVQLKLHLLTSLCSQNDFKWFFKYTANSLALLNGRKKKRLLAGWSGVSLPVFDWQQLQGHVCICV